MRFEQHTTAGTSGFSRRQALGLGAVLGLGTALAPGLIRPASAATSGSEALSRADAAFLNRGLQHGTWIAPNDPNRYVPSASVYRDQGGFNMPTFYDPNLYNKPLMDSMPGLTWAITKAPYANQIVGPPQPGVPFLNDQQQANAGNLFSICLGDEESYSTQRVTWFSQFAAQARASAPNALLHTNQYSGQWSDAQLRTYIKAVQPDLLSWDNYYYSTSGNGRFNAGSVTSLYNDTWRYRRLALEGLDGLGGSPLAFGQYTLGYRNGTSQEKTGSRVVSETEQFLPAFVTWALGGKWLNLFRWEWAKGDAHWLLNDETGGLTAQYYRYQKLNRMMANLSPYLVRLRTRNAGIVAGKTNTGSIVATPGSNIPAFSSTTDPGTSLVSVTVKTAPAANGNLPTDTLIGTFRPIPGLTAAQLDSFIPATDSVFFMVVNAVGFANSNISDRNGTGGESSTLRQTVTLTFDLAGTGRTPTALRVVKAADGSVSQVGLKALGGSRYSVDHAIDGATGDLFYWA